MCARSYVRPKAVCECVYRDSVDALEYDIMILYIKL